jgi:phosphoadenosine phosphosulfate reductase
MNEIEWLEPKTEFEIMDEAIKDHNLDSIYVLFSGGKDSVSTADFISKNYPKQFKGCVFTVTGFGVPDTRSFAVNYCKLRGWPLFFTWPKEKERYYNMVLKHGFPGQGNHQMWMGFLKYHTWYQFMKWRLSLGEKACFISGVRKKESWARDKKKVYSKQPVDLDGKMIFIKPFLYKNGIQLWKYFNENELKKSPVYDWFDKSGECLCGAHAEEWELKMLEKNYPLGFEYVKWLEKQIMIHGTKKAKKYNQWGNGPKATDVENQMDMTEFFGNEINVNEDYCGESCQVN